MVQISGSAWNIDAHRVKDVDKHTHLVTATDGELTADVIIFAVSRVGSRAFPSGAKRRGMTNNQVDIGVRVELRDRVEHFSAHL